MNYSVYWICTPDHTDIFNQGYVGVSSNPEKRWIRHWKYNGNAHLKNAIKKYGWEQLIKKVILVGEKNYCFDIEKQLRPSKQIGWNIAEGGAKPPISQPRVVSYVSPLKGKARKTPWLFNRKLSEKERKNISERRKVKIKYKNVVYDSFECLANFLGIKYSTLTNRIYRNAAKYGYEVLK